MNPGWIGLDVGTTSLKAVAYDGWGRSLGQARTPTTWTATAHGAQLDPRQLAAAAGTTLGTLADRLPDDVMVAGIGITSMGEVGVLIGPDGQVVAPAIAWHDTRDDDEVADLAARIGAHEFGARAGKPLRGQFSLTKHRWLVQHQETARAAVRRFNVADWVARALGAGEVCDRVLACRTGWFDIAAGDWWDDALAWSRAARTLMPELADPGTPIGPVRSGHPRLLGATVTTAGHDHQAAALGAGATDAGDELDSSGTAEAIVRTIEPSLTREQVRTLAQQGITTDLSVQAGRWSLLGGTEGGLLMQRTLDELGVEPGGRAALDRQALSLDGTPARDDDPAQRWRSAVTQATAAALVLHSAISAVAGPHQRFIVTGGWARSELVLAAKRRAFGAVEVSTRPEAGCFGAAILATRATGDEFVKETG